MPDVDADLEAYRRDGFLLVPGLFDPAAIDRFEQRFLDLVAGAVPRDPAIVLMKDVMVVKGDVSPETPLHGLNKLLSFENDPVLFDYVLAPRLLEIVRALVGRDLMTLSTNVFNKPPGVDGRHPLHQDLRYFTLRPADGILGTWTAITPSIRENGCLSVVPGSHRRGLLEHGDPEWERVNSGFFAARDVDLDERVHVEMQPGDTLLFHPLLLHGSGRNRSDGFRRAISAHFASTGCRWPEGPRKRAPIVRRLPSREA